MSEEQQEVICGDSEPDLNEIDCLYVVSNIKFLHNWPEAKFFTRRESLTNSDIIMPVTIGTAQHPGKKYPQLILRKTADDFFQNDYSYQRSADCVLSSTFDPKDPIVPQPCGFVSTVMMAYAKHYHLVIRPDDIWITIISQLSFYINANAEDLRKKFVAHEKKKELEVLLPSSTLSGIDWDFAGDAMIKLMHEDLVDKELKDWIIPNFSTRLFLRC
jgi:Domain of unknown function (DUF4419)